MPPAPPEFSRQDILPTPYATINSTSQQTSTIGIENMLVSFDTFKLEQPRISNQNSTPFNITTESSQTAIESSSVLRIPSLNRRKNSAPLEATTTTTVSPTATLSSPTTAINSPNSAQHYSDNTTQTILNPVVEFLYNRWKVKRAI